jgi:trans-L-3-hydroxyproline dehydratase
MYGAILRPNTEMTQSGQAHMGVLFMTNDGYSTMCGHATIALGRFLVDTHDLNVFPGRNDIEWDRKVLIAYVNIHAPCGLLRVKVPVNRTGTASDPSRPVSFVSVPSFATGLGIPVSIHTPWPRLKERDNPVTEVLVNFAYGGAFYAIVEVSSLGFNEGLEDIDMDELSKTVKHLLSDMTKDPKLTQYYQHPEESEMSLLYGVIVMQDIIRDTKQGSVCASELGVCFFADQQIDRSPTGSGVAARAALAYCKNERDLGESRTYHSPVSHRELGPPFMGTIEQETTVATSREKAQVRVRVDGQAFYTGFSTFSVEPEDPLGDSGFVFTKL